MNDFWWLDYMPEDCDSFWDWIPKARWATITGKFHTAAAMMEFEQQKGRQN